MPRLRDIYRLFILPRSVRNDISALLAMALMICQQKGPNLVMMRYSTFAICRTSPPVFGDDSSFFWGEIISFRSRDKKTRKGVFHKMVPKNSTWIVNHGGINKARVINYVSVLLRQVVINMYNSYYTGYFITNRIIYFENYLLTTCCIHIKLRDVFVSWWKISGFSSFERRLIVKESYELD